MKANQRESSVITVYAGDILPGTDDVLHLGSSIKQVEKKVVEILREIKLEDDLADLPSRMISVLDLDTLKLDDALAILNERKKLGECI